MKTSALLTLDAVRAAHTRIADGVRPTPCTRSASLSQLTGMEIILKHDYQQATGSFKERGALNALLCLSPEQRSRGVLAASAGNHALGLAYHGRRLGIAVTVLMPHSAPLVKVNRCRELGAHVLQSGRTYDECAAHAARLSEERQLPLIHPFDDLNVIAGQGTLALEALYAFPEAAAIVLPVGGGGLLAGCAVAIKSLRPDLLVIGVEPAHAAGLTIALDVGRPIRVPVNPTLADGLSVACTGKNTFALNQLHADRVVTVTEDALAHALLQLHTHEHLTLEGAGAIGLAACLAGLLPELSGRQVIVPLTGKNIDPATHQNALHRARALSQSYAVER